MVGVNTLDCAGCGAPLEISPGSDFIECSYCGRTLSVERGHTQATEPSSSSGPTVSDGLLRGYDGEDLGRGARYSVAEMKSRDWVCYERGVWPTAARSSSTFGRSWNSEAARGAPRVYPRYGDYPGAWAPRRRTSHTEWLEAQYPPEVGPVQAIRVFETCAAGSTFALTIRDSQGQERVVWKQRPGRPMAEAQVLEVSLDRPERVASVRAYVTNDHATWTQIDTIGLVAVDPIPIHLRQYPEPPARLHGATMVIVIATLLALLGGGAALYIMAATSGQQSSASEGQTGAAVEAPAQMLDGSVMAPWHVEGSTLSSAGIHWATQGLEASSEYRPDGWSRHQLAGPPDVFPMHGDKEQAWATQHPDDGVQWVSVAFGDGVEASAVIIVETFNPGALIGIDDISRPEAPVGLWRGVTASAQTSRVLRLTLPASRRISRLRLLLDTRLVTGWNEIDAVGLSSELP